MRLTTVIILTSLISFSVAANEKDVQKDVIIKETQNKSVFKGFLYQVWNKMRALNPKANASHASRNKVIATAGIRGTESTSTVLEPYWKDDLTSDKTFLKEIEALGQAQSLIDDGQLEQGKNALNNFLDTYPNSMLKANAVFSKGVVLGGLGDNLTSVAVFNDFIKDNPDHPLIPDAKLAVQELSK